MSRAVRTIPGAWANELMMGDNTNVRIEQDEQIDESRWYTKHRIVFTIPGLLGFYALDVKRPKTELQEYDSFDSKADVPVILVRPKVVQTVVFEEFEDEE